MSGGDGSDRELAQRVIGGDEDAFLELFRALYPRLYRFAVRRLDGDHALCEEIVQSSMAKAFDRLDRFRGEGTLFSWACGFCRFAIQDHFRRVGRRPPTVSADSPEGASRIRALAAAEDPDRDLERAELARRVRSLLDDLPLRYSRALELRYLEECGVAEIAEHLELGIKAAESLLTRARAALRRALGEQDRSAAWRTAVRTEEGR